jgi:CBS domain-containing protein
MRSDQEYGNVSRKGPKMPEEILNNLSVGNISNLVVKDPTIVGPDCTLDELLAKIVEDTRTRHAYVVDEGEHLVGSVRLSNLIQRLFPYGTLAAKGDAVIMTLPHLLDTETVGEFMNTDPYYVNEETPLKEVAGIMAQENVGELPIVDDEKRVIGEVNVLEILENSEKP